MQEGGLNVGGLKVRHSSCCAALISRIVHAHTLVAVSRARNHAVQVGQYDCPVLRMQAQATSRMSDRRRVRVRSTGIAAVPRQSRIQLQQQRVNAVACARRVSPVC
jgi:hypothetical protein